VAWQFPAEDREVLRASFGQLAAQLGAQDAADTSDPVPSVHAVLARFPSPWLLIFDNAADMASIAEFQPPAGSGQVLITSQNQNWPGQVLNVPVLHPEVAANFLVSRSGDQNPLAAAELARELDGLPLALEQAGAYVRARSGRLAGYLAAFQQRRLAVLERSGPTLYGKTVATTWSLAFEQLEISEPSAVGLLRLLACCAPEAVPLDLLLQPRPWLAELDEGVAASLAPLLEDPLAAGDAIASLRRYSLATPVGEGQVSVHRLVQAVTINQMPELADRWRQAAASLIEAAIVGTDSRLPHTWRIFGSLLPHAEKALPPQNVGIERIASYLGNSGSYATARDLQRRTLEAREQILGTDHPDTLTARRNLARWVGEAGDAAEALDQDEKMLPVIEGVLGPEHRDTLGVHADIAHWTRKARRRAEPGHQHPVNLADPTDRPSRTRTARGPALAVARYAELLPEFQRILGEEDLDTLALRADLAWATGEAKDTAEARNQFAGLWPMVERVLGPEDPLTLDVRAGLARWTGSADPAAALDQFVDLLPEYERIMGPGHPATLYIVHSVARWTGQAGDPAQARDRYAALLSERERILGPDHPDTRVARRNLAYWTKQAGSEEV
jgi:Tetratricopeptide repeat